MRCAVKSEEIVILMCYSKIRGKESESADNVLRVCDRIGEDGA